MWRLFQYPLCPFSRKVRFACAVKAVPVELVLEHPWDRRDGFAALNPAMQTPVLVLNASYEPINICGARRALVLVLKGVARTEEEQGAMLHAARMQVAMPSVI